MPDAGLTTVVDVAMTGAVANTMGDDTLALTIAGLLALVVTGLLEVLQKKGSLLSHKKRLKVLIVCTVAAAGTYAITYFGLAMSPQAAGVAAGGGFGPLIMKAWLKLLQEDKKPASLFPPVERLEGTIEPKEKTS